MKRTRIRLDRWVSAVAALVLLLTLLTILHGSTFWFSLFGVLSLAVIVGAMFASMLIRGGSTLRPLFRGLAGLMAIAAAYLAARLLYLAVVTGNYINELTVAFVFCIIGACYLAFCAVRGHAPVVLSAFRFRLRRRPDA